MNQRLKKSGVFLLALVFFHLATSCVDQAGKNEVIVQRKQSSEDVTNSGAIPVKIVRTANGFQLLRGGKPYFIKGAGGLEGFAKIKAMGGNSVRLWTTDYAQILLDSAHAQGLTVLLGLWLVPEKEGLDYYDRKAVKKQRLALREEILRYRNHPALLAWDIGNELEQGASNPDVFDAINEVAQMVHELDPNHPAITTFIQPGVVTWMGNRCKDLDLIAFNSYGNIANLQKYLRQVNWPKPYIITEFGARGYWEVRETPWEASYEPSSTQKAQEVALHYRIGVEEQRGKCLGSYVFYWGNRQEGTPTWFSLFTPTGERTDVVDQVQHLWRGDWPANRAPHVKSIHLNQRIDKDNVRLVPGQPYPAAIVAQDHENDSLRIEWEVQAESRWKKDRKTLQVRDEPIAGAVLQPSKFNTTVVAPTKPGPYRLYATIYDGHGGAATANVPFYVQKPE